MTSFDDRMASRPKRTLLGLLGWTALAVVLVGGVGTGITLLSQPGRVLTKTFDADNMIHKYEWFKTTYQDYLGNERNIADKEAALADFEKSHGDRSTWKAATEREFNRQASIISGLKSVSRRIVSEYNAASSMANRAIFKEGVPATLPQQ